MSVLQDEQTFLINFNLINEGCLAIRVVHDTKCHMITTEPIVLSLSLCFSLAEGLWVFVSHAQMLDLRLQCLAKITDFSERWKVPTSGTSVFLSLQSNSTLLFHTKVRLRMLCFILGKAACRYRPFPLLPYCQLLKYSI